MPNGTDPSWMPKFRKALVQAFDEGSIDLLTSDYFGISFPGVSPAGFGKTFEYRLLELLRNARQEDWLLDLVAAARERRPKNATIAEIAEGIGLTASGPRLQNPTGKPLEEIVNANAKMIKPAVFREQLAALETRVCRIVIPGGGGTGFLVGPDLIVTNDHVIERLRSEPPQASASDVRCWFDYRETLDGSTLTRKKVVEVPLADEWLVDRQPPSAFDWDPALGNAAPAEADYALLRLAEPVGDLPVGGDTVDAQAPRRGWIQVNGAVPPLAAGNQVFLLQHPKDEPLQLAVGEVVAFNPNGTRVRYNANSKDGSSGSPCFNADLELVALHHARDPHTPPAWNQAIPFGRITAIWKKN